MKSFDFYHRDIMVQDDAKRREIFDEIEALCLMHQKITQSSECRDFNHRAALLLVKLEDAGFNRLADRAMDLLACCNPKDLSQCDSVQRARDVLGRMREMAADKEENRD
ncbi:MAG: hypothetical protein ACP5OU_06055 [Methanothrix sp.]